MLSALAAALLAFGPFGTPSAPVTRDAVATSAKTSSDGDSHFELAYRFYQSFISPMDGPRCAHRPTCSRYALLAVRQEGPFIGTLLAIDRLMRGDESSSLRKLRLLNDGQTLHFYDPVEESTFWLHSR